MNTQKLTNKCLSASQLLEFASLRAENDLLKKKVADIYASKKQESYSKDATIRKLEKQTRKLQQEVNALKVSRSGMLQQINGKQAPVQLSLTIENKKERLCRFNYQN